MSTSNENYKILINSSNNTNYYGVIDKDNKVLIKTEYVYIEYAFNNYFIVCGKNGKLGVLDDTGKTVIDLKYDLVQKVDNKEVIQTLLADTNTTELYASDMSKMCTMKNATVNSKDDYIKVHSATEINYYNNEGKEVSSSKIFPDHNLFVEVRDGKWGYVDKTGATKVDFIYERATEFNDYGYAAIKSKGKWGVIDSEGKIVVEPKYKINENTTSIEFLGEYLKIENGFGDVYYTKNK